MDSHAIFVLASAVVLIALIASFACWIGIHAKTSGTARMSAKSFVACFGLYIIGQGLALLQGMGLVNGFWAVPSLCYAVAALVFAIGSFQQLKSLRYA